MSDSELTRLRTALAAAEAREAEMRIREGDMFFEATRRMLEGNELRDKLAAAEGREAALRGDVAALAKSLDRLAEHVAGEAAIRRGSMRSHMNGVAAAYRSAAKSARAILAPATEPRTP